MARGKSCGAMTEDKADGSFDWAAKGVARATKGNGITFALVFLGGEVETHPGGCLDVPEGG